ncbi:unnamed protein product [Notodromas monacha]|uniref:non-specific serine/threonine protein kinase n=1 Tax=Notodromas monacha TaxID=399045 RepID=A0A7R9BDX6_9CRUS|nr:unnamed protein product [Notodromas monacha]CAG0912880.1 unnamed protein product [Notodromas monacha]
MEKIDGSDHDGKGWNGEKSVGSNVSATKKSMEMGIVSTGACFNRQPTKTAMTPYEKIVYDCNHDEKWAKEVTLGKRVSFYRFKSDIGSGNFSQVKSAVHQLTKEKVAIKILDKTRLDHKTQKMLSREIINMDKLVHPNIIRLFQVVETLSRIHLIMEYAGGGELFAYITNKGKLSEDESKVIFSQLVSAVSYMHGNNMVHRDIKAENVFYASPRWVKLGDFGFSIGIANNENLKTFCGSPPYAAPELFQDDSYAGCPVDVWALGVLLYFMVSGLMPFRAQTVAALKKLIVAGDFSVPENMPEGAKEIVSSILVQEPMRRPTLTELQNHAWLKGTGGACCLNFSHDDAHALVLKEMNRLGIPEEMLRTAETRGNRSTVIGIYRVLFTKVQNRRLSSSPRIPGLCVDSSPQKSVPKTPGFCDASSKQLSGCLTGKSGLFHRVSNKSKACVIQ